MAIRCGRGGSSPIDAACRLRSVNGLVGAVGDGITGLVGGAFHFIGGSLRGMVDAANAALPGGLLLVVVFLGLLLIAWNFAKR